MAEDFALLVEQVNLHRWINDHGPLRLDQIQLSSPFQ